MANSSIIGSIILEGASTSEDAVITSTSSNKRVIAEGTLQDLDVENRNHRIYAKKDILPEINGPRLKELIEAQELRGEFSHPLSDSIVRQQTIDGKLACVKYLKIWVEGNRVKGQFKGTNNAYGEEFDQDLREGGKPAFSLRALGSIENQNGKAYVKNIKIITYDRVIYPSHRTAYTERILSESAIDDSISSNVSITDKKRMIEEMNENGRIIHITGGDAQDVINKLQRESASIDAILETFSGLADDVRVINEGRNVLLTTRFGDRITLNLGKYVGNLIMNYVWGA